MTQELVISSVNELLKIVDDANERLRSPMQIFWRGQAEDWPLVPSIFREGRTSFVENNVLSIFKNKAHSRYSKCPKDDDLTRWLFLMQHYRLPTRLLDWTESPLIAMYFAVFEDNESDGFLYALDPFSLNETFLGERVIPDSLDSNVTQRVERAFKSDDTYSEDVLALMPMEFDLRIMKQLSGFTIHSTRSPLQGMNKSKKYLIKYKIPGTNKKHIQNQLDAFSINETTIFPDLDHLSSYLTKKMDSKDIGRYFRIVKSSIEEQANAPYQESEVENETYGGGEVF